MMANQEQPEQSALSKKEERQVQAYVTGLAKMLHGESTRQQIYNILQAGPPQETIPQAAMLVNERMEEAAGAKGQDPSPKVLLNAAIYLVSDLVEIGHAGGFFQLTKEDLPMILQDTMQEYIHSGLKKGTIDPVELQALTEANMTPEQKAQGMSMAGRAGIAPEAGPSVQMEQYAVQRENKVKNQVADKAAGQNMQGALQGAQNQGGMQ